MDYIKQMPFFKRRQTELILPFTYSVVLSSEAEFLTCSLCKHKPPFAIYGKPVGDKAPTTDPDAMKQLAVVYELILMAPKDHNITFS